MSHIETILRAQTGLDYKWLKTDLQTSFHSQESLQSLWNTLIIDEELTGDFSQGVFNSVGALAKKGDFGKYYCGLRVLTCTCCDTICGPTSGCNCGPCQKLYAEEGHELLNETHFENNQKPQQILDFWTWGPKPNYKQLTSLIRSLNVEQYNLCLHAANTTLSSVRLHQRLMVFKRYFIAANRVPPKAKFDHSIIKLQMQNSTNSLVSSTKGTSMDVQDVLTNQTNLEEKSIDPCLGWARVGSRAALNFSFAFLRRAWKLGEDTEVCTEFLLESLDTLQLLPVATLFDDKNLSIWLEVVDRSIKFLRQVVLGDLNCGRQITIPIEDQHTALNLLLELSLQKGTLSDMLEMAILFLNLCEKSTHIDDNRNRVLKREMYLPWTKK